jgi:hypothetical protein
MKKKVIFRVLGIGIFHMVLYLYIVPFLIYPKFGHNGYIFAVVVAVTISIAVVGTIFISKNKGDKNV